MEALERRTILHLWRALVAFGWHRSDASCSSSSPPSISLLVDSFFLSFFLVLLSEELSCLQPTGTAARARRRDSDLDSQASQKARFWPNTAPPCSPPPRSEQSQSKATRSPPPSLPLCLGLLFQPFLFKSGCCLRYSCLFPFLRPPTMYHHRQAQRWPQ